jgi:autotransporter-associated beta strand protein
MSISNLEKTSHLGRFQPRRQLEPCDGAGRHRLVRDVQDHPSVPIRHNRHHGLTFNTDALHYTLDIPTGQQLTVGSGGIVVKGGSAKFTNEGTFTFQSSTAAVSSAGKAHIVNTGASSTLLFLTHGSAGRAHIANSDAMHFEADSTAGKASITNDDTILVFNNDSTAGSATITSTNNSLIIFVDNANAGSAWIIASGGQVDFEDNSTAGNATINAVSAAIHFLDNSDGGNARLSAQAFSAVNFSFGTGPAGDHKISVGSIAGAVTFELGQTVLTVGSNNRSTTVSGLIQDGGPGGGTEAELVKVGTRTLKLTHANNTYSLATILDAGTFDVAALGAAGPGLIVFDSFISGTHSTLKIENAALSTHVFGNLIFNFAAGDKIDLHGLNSSAAPRRP